MVKTLIELFESANDAFLRKNEKLILDDVSERTLCGALMIELYEALKQPQYAAYAAGYYVDVEYNRNYGEVKRIKRINEKGELKVDSVVCDLLVHSRGCKQEDNLIALEMKKAKQKLSEKEKDKDRLKVLTTPNTPHNGVYFYPADDAGKKYVCGYKLGIYYEVDWKKRKILIEYYSGGRLKEESKRDLCGRKIT